MSSTQPNPSEIPSASAHAAPNGPSLALTLGAIGIVFGDIGTSPLYTVQECFGAHGVPATPDNVLGIISLIVYAVTLVVTIKYLFFVMRADNRGEGGILALLALLPPQILKAKAVRPPWIVMAALLGAALLFGDGIITPAISVLSAMEGLKVATPVLEPMVIPATVAILIGLFLIQKRGTEFIGRFFGPVMVVWFLTIGMLGLANIFKAPQILGALSPVYGLQFFLHNGFHGFKLLGAVVLAVTGGEALYADMGHFGRSPIRRAWLGLIYPALLLCYLGQGAVLLLNPEAADKPFFHMLPLGLWTYALVAIAAPATVIASQALISGVFSLTRQAVQLGYFPRVAIKHTSSATEGQIYVPFLNAVLAIACIALVLIFRESSNLAAAFGLAVSGTMAITSVLFFYILRHTWQVSRFKASALLVFFLAFDLPFLGANMLKFMDGGYLPLGMAVIFLSVMLIWKQGRTFLARHYRRNSEPLDAFLARLAQGHPYRPDQTLLRSPGTGVFMASSANGAPPILLHFVRRLSTLPETVVIFTMITDAVPYVQPSEQLEVQDLGQGFYRLIAHSGFMEAPRVMTLLERAAREYSVPVRIHQASFFVGRETLLATHKGEMGAWSESVFAFMSKLAFSASLYFGIPPEQVIEVGIQIDL